MPSQKQMKVLLETWKKFIPAEKYLIQSTDVLRNPWTERRKTSSSTGELYALQIAVKRRFKAKGEKGKI